MLGKIKMLTSRVHGQKSWFGRILQGVIRKVVTIAIILIALSRRNMACSIDPVVGGWRGLVGIGLGLVQ